MTVHIEPFVFETSSTVGTGQFSLSSQAGYRTFSSAAGTGASNEFYYFIRHETASEYEHGKGYIDTGTGDLIRSSVIKSSNSDTLVNFTSGTKQITLDISPKQIEDSVILVKQASDLSGTLVSDKTYIVDGTVDMGAQAITVPEGGLSISGVSGGRDTSVLTSSENSYTMFITDTYSGDLVMSGLTITTDGTSSQVFDLDNNGNGNGIDIDCVNFTSCTSLGELTAYRQLLLNVIGFISISDGLTVSGTWSGGISVINSIAISFPAATLFKEGTSLVIQGSVRSNINFLGVNSASILFDFDEANISSEGGMDLQDVRTTASDAVPNLPQTSTKARYRNCLGMGNTYVGSEYEVTTGATTTISAANTLYKMAGTTTYAEEHWFSNTTDNAFVYDSTIDIEVDILGTLSFTGGTNDVMGIQIRQWDDSASSYVDISARFKATLNGGGAGTRAENVTVMGSATISENDRIEIWVENQTDTTDIDTDTASFVYVREKPS